MIVADPKIQGEAALNRPGILSENAGILEVGVHGKRRVVHGNRGWLAVVGMTP